MAQKKTKAKIVNYYNEMQPLIQKKNPFWSCYDVAKATKNIYDEWKKDPDGMHETYLQWRAKIVKDIKNHKLNRRRKRLEPLPKDSFMGDCYCCIVSPTGLKDE